jgi:transcriptional regulator with XRE-family HTH domain
MTRYDEKCTGLWKRKAWNLRRLRLRMGLKQREIAEVLHVKENVVSDMERCKRPITDRVIEVLSRTYDLDFEEFLMHEESYVLSNYKERAVVDKMRKAEQLKEQIYHISEVLAKDYQAREREEDRGDKKDSEAGRFQESREKEQDKNQRSA